MSTQQKKKIMVVDDNMISQKIAFKCLTSSGYKCNMVVDADQVLSFIEKERYDLIFMDIMLNVSDGFALTQEIRRTSMGSRVPIIALTANSDKSCRAKCLAAGMNDFLKKPYNKEALVEIIEKHTS